jgi:ABC-2 type transport system ATP-binding protein
MTHLVEAREPVKVFPGVRAVDGLSFEVRRGQCFGLLGPNGAGKTTTLEMLEGISRPTAGEVLYQGRPLDRAFREEIGIQFQSTALQDFQTVRESLRMFASLYRRTTDLDELIALCKLSEILDRDTRKLSGGQRQRLLLAIALVNDPLLLFLDEPTTGLDPQSRRNFWGLIEAVRRRGKTVVLTTHYMEEAQRLADRVAIIARGEIVAEGPPDELGGREGASSEIRFRLPAETTVAELPTAVGAAAQRDNGLVAIRAERPVEALHELTGWALERGIDLRGLEVSRPTLEDVYIELTAPEPDARGER